MRFVEFCRYDPTVDCEMVRLSTVVRGEEYFIRYPSEEGPGARDRKLVATEAIKQAIARGDPAGEVLTRPRRMRSTH